jgi:hypothetical protein
LKAYLQLHIPQITNNEAHLIIIKIRQSKLIGSESSQDLRFGNKSFFKSFQFPEATQKKF